MEILWLAIVFYSIGLGLVLHFKPSLMFNENGTWKEFGYQRAPGKTLFPVWLFAITWAFLSYTLAACGTWIFAAASASSLLSSFYADADAEAETDAEVEDLEPVSEVRKRGRPRKNVDSESANPRPGYYVVDPETSEKGLRRYVYYGPDAPNS